MSKIEELIKQHCPNGVEYKKLGEVCNILDNQRKPVSKGNRVKGIYPYYGANGIQDYVNDYIFDGIFLLIGEDGSVINQDNSPVLNWATGKIWVNNHSHILSEKSDIAKLRFVYFYLSTIDVSSLVRGTPPKLNQQNLKSIKIPIPPMPVQEEIVRILNAFTKLKKELEKELEKRKQQYEYYRNKLLTFDENTTGGGIKFMLLSEVCNKIVSGKNKSKKEEGLYPVYGSTGIIAYTDEYIYEGEKILVARVGANAGYIHLSKGKYDVSDNTIIIEPQNNHSLKYLYYQLQNHNLHQYAKGGGQPLVTAGELKNIIIPIPSIEEQERIVGILDKFDALVNDISIGLPAEINARRQQYEHYRNKLLTFEEVA